ncbi:phage repressor protein CI [Pantoea septica]|uniref:phage repressor protein CI n=1 Tax=Pantoea septica TaxID=472695 RepID=UPI0028976130|nr:phage repressor protein CI [Pantoea septica]
MSNTIESPKGITEHLYPSQGGGKEAISRIMSAYHFNTRQALCNHLGISQSTMANRWMRDTFPHDWLIACHLDTGTPLLWLATGQGASRKEDKEEASTRLRYKKISNGVEQSSELVSYDARLLPANVSDPFFVEIDNAIYLIEGAKAEVTDGLWLIDIDGLISIKEVYRLPGKKLRVENGPASFDCAPDDINVLGRIVSKTESV